MAIHVDLETPTWRYRSWRGPVRGVLVAVLGGSAGLAAAAGILGIDGAAEAVHLDIVQDVVIAVSMIVAFVMLSATAVLVVRTSQPILLASGRSGLVLTGTRPMCISWGVIEDVRLKTRHRRAVPLLCLRSGAEIPINRGWSDSRPWPGNRSRLTAGTQPQRVCRTEGL